MSDPKEPVELGENGSTERRVNEARSFVSIFFAMTIAVACQANLGAAKAQPSYPSRVYALFDPLRQHQALGGGEAVFGEEVEEIVPGDLGPHRLEVKGGEVGHEL